MRRCTLARILALVLTAAPGIAYAAAAQPTPAAVTISGKITGLSGNHPVHIALWDAAGFLDHPSQQLRIEAHGNAVFQFRVSRGEWSISAYEDVNENGKLDMGMFGPKEPSGFWRAFHGWHKPRFKEVSSAVDKDVFDADISLR